MPDRGLERTQGSSLTDSLSEREKQLLQLAARGYTDQGIANRLGISLATVGTYWGRVRIKLGPLNRTELVAVHMREEATKAMVDLRSQNEKLQAEIEQRSKHEAMLKTSLDLFRGLIETAPDAILVVNKDGIVQLANEKAEEMFGYTRNDLLGKSVEDLTPEQNRQMHIVHREEYNSHPSKRRMGEHLATMARRKDGSMFPMATSLSAASSPSGLLITCIVRDLSEIKQTTDEQ